jgi:hypothetical protein
MMRRHAWRGFGGVGSVVLGACLGAVVFGCATGEELGFRSGADDGKNDVGFAPNGTGGTPAAPQNASGGDGDGGFVDPADCETDCMGAAVSGCNVNGFTAAAECQALCAQSPNATELTCIADAPCSTLTHSLATGASICEIPAFDPAPSDAGEAPSDAGEGGAPASSSACTNNCFSAVLMCLEDASAANADCVSLCARGVTIAQLDCITGSSCSYLDKALASGESICGIPERDDAGPP